jgi:hypothetical protein
MNEQIKIVRQLNSCQNKLSRQKLPKKKKTGQIRRVHNVHHKK